MTSKPNPFGPDARARRRLVRLQRFAGAFATSPTLPGNQDGPLDRGNLPTEAIKLATDFLGQFTWPIMPQLVYRGIRQATRDERTPAIEADAHVILSCHIVTLTGCRREVDVPLVVRKGTLLEPSVMVVDGVPRILSQSLVDEIVRQGTFSQKVDPRGGMYGLPMDGDAYAAWSELDAAFKEQDRYSRGMYSIASRTAQQDDDSVVTIEYGTVPNGYAEAGGFLPVVWLDGRQRGDTYASHGYDQDEALARAKQEAEEMGAKYIGDWKVTVTERQARIAQRLDEPACPQCGGWLEGGRRPDGKDCPRCGEFVRNEDIKPWSPDTDYPASDAPGFEDAPDWDDVRPRTGQSSGDPKIITAQLKPGDVVRFKRDYPPDFSAGSTTKVTRQTPDNPDTFLIETPWGEEEVSDDQVGDDFDIVSPHELAEEHGQQRLPGIESRRAQEEYREYDEQVAQQILPLLPASPAQIADRLGLDRAAVTKTMVRMWLSDVLHDTGRRGPEGSNKERWIFERTARHAQRYEPGARVKVSGDPARVLEQVHEPTGNGAFDGTYRVEWLDGRTDVVPESKLSVDKDQETMRHVESGRQGSRQGAGCFWCGEQVPVRLASGLAKPLCRTCLDLFMGDGAFDRAAQSRACPTCGTPLGRYIPGYHPETGSRCTSCAECPARWKAKHDTTGESEGNLCDGCKSILADGPGAILTVTPLEPIERYDDCPECQGAGCRTCDWTGMGDEKKGVKQGAREGDGQPAEHNETRKQDDFVAGESVEFAKPFRNRTRGGPSYLVDSGTGATVVKDVAEDGTSFEVRLDDGRKTVVPREMLRRARRADQVPYPPDGQQFRCKRCGKTNRVGALVSAEFADGPTVMACPSCYSTDLDRVAGATVDQIVREVEALKQEGYDDLDAMLAVHGKYPALAEAAMQAARDKGLLDLDGE